MRKTWTLLAAGVLVGPGPAWAAETPVVWPAAQIKWVDLSGIPGAKMAVLWGDPKTGAYGALKKLPGGKTLALHTHTFEQKVLTVSGSIALTLEGGAAQELPAGSYALIPAGAKHTAECKTGSDCLYFEQQPGASDTKFVEK